MSDLLKKLQWKDRTNLGLMNPPESFLKELQGIQQAGVLILSEKDFSASVQGFLIFTMNLEELTKAEKTIAPLLQPQTLLWICYPKKSSKNYSSDLTRDHGWDRIGKLGYEPVRQISIDQDWSALRFKPVTEIKELTRKASMMISRSKNL